MQVTVEKLSPTQARISFNVPSSEYEAEVQSLLKQLGRQMRVKGFRPGHVPPAVVAKQRGEEVRFETVQRFLQKAYRQAIEENELKPLSSPRVDVEAIERGEGGDLAHEFEITLKPEFELPEYKELEIESELAPVMEEEVQAAIEEACRNQAHPEPAGDEGLPVDGMALATIEMSHEGEVVFTREGLRLGPTTAVPGIEPAALEQALVGLKDGEEAELPVRFPPDFEKEQARDQMGTCRILVNQAFRIVVPDRAELCKMLSIEDEPALVERAREKLQEANQNQEHQRIESALMERLIEATDFEPPQAMVDEQFEARSREISEGLASQGLQEAQVAEEVSKQEPQLRSQALKGAKAYFLIEAIAEKEKLKVSEQELAAELRSIAQRNQTSFEEVSQFYKEQNLFPQLAMEIVERKVKAFLRDSARIGQPG